MSFLEWRLLALVYCCGMYVGSSTNSNGVLINEVHAFLGVHHVAFGCAVHISLLDVEVSACFLHIVSTLGF